MDYPVIACFEVQPELSILFSSFCFICFQRVLVQRAFFFIKV